MRGNDEVIASLEGMLGNTDSCPHSFFSMAQRVVARQLSQESLPVNLTPADPI